MQSSLVDACVVRYDVNFACLPLCTIVHILRTWSYEWDEQKAAANLIKHGIDFADAATALEDEAAVTIADEFADEERFVTIGMDVLGRLRVVVYA